MGWVVRLVLKVQRGGYGHQVVAGWFVVGFR